MVNNDEYPINEKSSKGKISSKNMITIINTPQSTPVGDEKYKAVNLNLQIYNQFLNKYNISDNKRYACVVIASFK